MKKYIHTVVKAELALQPNASGVHIGAWCTIGMDSIRPGDLEFHQVTPDETLVIFGEHECCGRFWWRVTERCRDAGIDEIPQNQVEMIDRCFLPNLFANRFDHLLPRQPMRDISYASYAGQNGHTNTVWARFHHHNTPFLEAVAQTFKQLLHHLYLPADAVWCPRSYQSTIVPSRSGQLEYEDVSAPFLRKAGLNPIVNAHWAVFYNM